jgi:hypothetical protein
LLFAERCDCEFVALLGRRQDLSVERLRKLFPEQLQTTVQIPTDPHGNVAYAVVTRTRLS